jgi:hypothetical protein
MQYLSRYCPHPALWILLCEDNVFASAAEGHVDVAGEAKQDRCKSEWGG